MGYAVIKREILFLSGFTNKGNWIGLNFKITIENYKSTIFAEGEVVLPGPGVSPMLVFLFFNYEDRYTFGEGLCYKLGPGHVAFKIGTPVMTQL